jgi:hypothetical protein
VDSGLRERLALANYGDRILTPLGSAASLRVRWQPEIAPGATVCVGWSIVPEPVHPAGRAAPGAHRLTAAGLRTTTRIGSDSPGFDGVLARGIADLDLLVTPGPGPGQRFLAAGIPWFTALFSPNQGHALWSGVVSDAHAGAVAEHLGGPGLDSGWGLRTYAAGQPGYNRLGYHTRAVWPHDTALAVAGLRRTGFDAPAVRLAGELLEAAQTFPEARLPELFCGFGRDEAGLPVAYPMACAPQTWAAAAPLTILRALLGIRPSAAEMRLELVRPVLPARLEHLHVSGLRVGGARVNLHCSRHHGSTRVEVVGLVGDLAVKIRA